jgi:hypothetical protein
MLLGVLLIVAQVSGGDALAQARALYDRLEYELVLPLVEQALADPTVTGDDKLDAFRIQGSSLAVLGRTVDAENAFRLLLRARPGVDLDKNTPPKILTVFRKVQLEEDRLREELKEFELKKVVDSLELVGEPPTEARGGRPLVFQFGVRDPTSSVATVQLHYRRAGEGGFSSVALTRDVNGQWRGEIPGEWTANDDGFTLEYHLMTRDKDGQTLLTVDSPDAPAKIEVSRGSVASAGPAYTQPWFWVVGGTATLAVAAAVTAGVVVATLPPASGLGVYELPP